MDVGRNLRKRLVANDKTNEEEMEEKRNEMNKELQKVRIKKAVCMANQVKLVEILRKIAELTDFPLKGSFGSEASKCVLVGPSNLDQLVDHIKSALEKGSQLSHPPSCSSPSECTHSNWEDDDQPKVKKAKQLVIYSSGDEEDGPQNEKSSRQPVVKGIERKSSDHVVPPLSPQPSSSNKSRLSYASIISSSQPKCGTKRGKDWDEEKWKSREKYEERRNINFPVLAESRNHDESEPRTKSFPKKFSELFADDNEDPVCVEVDYCPEGVLCCVCGVLFDNKASLSRHLKLKRNW